MGESVVDVEVFDIFDLTDYMFLEIDRGTIAGNVIVETFEAQGVFKLRSNFLRGDNSENKDSPSTLHIRSTESFLESLDDNLVGHGVTVDGKDYEIVGQTGGKNFHSGVIEHYTVTLQESDFSGFEESS